jgi:YD repeat-containing protein
LLAQSSTAYDTLGQVYQTAEYGVNPQTGDVDSNPLVSNTWYDADGNVIKTQTGTTGAFEKYAYDALGNTTESYTGYDTSPEDYAEAATVDGNDTILEQAQTWYDAASEAVATVTYEQFADGTPVTGPLAATDSYASGTATFYDGIGRDVEDVNYGHETTGDATHYFLNGSGQLIADSDGLPSVAEGSPPAPDSSAGGDKGDRRIYWVKCGLALPQTTHYMRLSPLSPRDVRGPGGAGSAEALLPRTGRPIRKAPWTGPLS